MKWNLVHLIWVCLLPAMISGESSILTPKKDVWDHNSVVACASHLNKLDWDYEHEHRAYYALLCEYSPAFGAWSVCIHDILEDKGKLDELFDQSLQTVKILCSYVSLEASNITIEQYHDAYNNATFYLHDYEETDEKLRSPVRIDRHMRDIIGHAFHGYAKNLDISNIFGISINIYFIIIIALISTLKYVNYNVVNLKLYRSPKLTHIRAKYFMPGLISKHMEYFTYGKYISGLLPTRLETLVIAGYLIIHVIMLFVSYDFDSYNIVFASKAAQVARYFGDRTGIMAFGHFPLILIFSTRNSFLERLTGFNYSTLIIFHKWIGRIMMVDSILHFISYFIYALLMHSVSSSLKLRFWRFGLYALLVAFCIVFLSMGHFRRHYYETFLYTHIFLAVLFLYCCWTHVRNFGWIDWIVSVMVIWVAERVFRIIRLIQFGFPKAKLSIVGDDLISVTVPLSATRNWTCKPGQYVFVYFMDPVIFWQSHPFTVIELDGKIRIVIKVKTGFTRYLHNKISLNDGTLQMRVSLEGPYGTSMPVQRFDNILLLAGGSGIPGPLYHAIDLAESSKAEETKIIHLVITAKDLAFVMVFKKELMRLQNSNIKTTIYLTGRRSEHVELDTLSAISDDYGSRESVSSTTDEDTFENRLSLFSDIKNGRPDIRQLLMDEVHFSRSLAVLACGPPQLMDNIRSIVSSKLVENPNEVIEYFEEYQCW